MNHKPVKILVVGQTPPPYFGQAMMIARLVNARFDNIKIYHVRMSFSSSIQSIGSFSFKKILHLFQVIYQVLVLRFRERVDTLYYPPAGPNRTPILRDIILLSVVRLFFKNVIYHFRAAGVSELMLQQPQLIQLLAKKVYGCPKASIQLSALNPADGKYFNSKWVYIIPNGLEDEAEPYLPLQKSYPEKINVLFVGILREDKGVMVLIEAARLLKQENNFQINFLGDFVSAEYEQTVRAKVREYELERHVLFQGVKTGAAKWRYFMESDIFCFPTYFESESFGNVIVEAMMFELPVVSTRWRGIPDIVVDGETGYLVPVKNPEAVAGKLSVLLQDSELRVKMGKQGRQRYLHSFTLQKHLKAMEEVLETAAIAD